MSISAHLVDQQENQPISLHSLLSGVRWADALQLPINLSVLHFKGAVAEQQGGKSVRTNSVPGPIINTQHQILVSSLVGFWSTQFNSSTTSLIPAGGAGA